MSKPHAMIERLARAQTRHPGWFLLGAALLTVAAGVVTTRLEFDSSYEALLPTGAPQISNMNDVRARTGGTRQVVVAIGGDDAKARRLFARELKPKIEKLEGVRYVDLEFPVEFFEQRGLLMLPTETLDELVEAVGEAIDASRWYHNPMNLHPDEEQEKAELENLWNRVAKVGESERKELPLSGMLESEDGRYTFLVVVPSIKFEDVKEGTAFTAAVESTVEAMGPRVRGLTVDYAGNLQIVQEMHATTRSDLRLASILALVLGILVVTAFTRRPMAPIGVGIPLVAGVAWTFAMVTMSIGHVNVVTGLLAAVLIGLGIDFGVHLFVRYQQERSPADEDPGPAMVRAVTATFRPAVTSAGTTAGTFFSFVLADFRGFSEFGVIAAMGVMLTFASSFLVLPPLMMIVDRLELGLPAGRHTLIAPPRGGPSMILCATVIAVFATLGAWGGFSGTRLGFENDFRKLRGESPTYDFFDYVNRNLGAGFNPAVILASSPDEASRIAREVESLRDQGRAERFGRVITVTDFLPSDAEAKMERVETLAEMVSDRKLDRAEGDRAQKLADARKMVEVQPWGIDALPESIARRFVTEGGEYIVYLWPDTPNYKASQAMVWEDQLELLKSQLADAGVTYSLAEETLIQAWIHRLILEETPGLLVVAGLVVVLLLLLDFRRIRDTLLVASPLLVGMFVFMGMMRSFEQPLNLFNIIVVPSIVGIGIDNSVHIYHRYRSLPRGSVSQVMLTTGIAALLASLTTAVGFGSSFVSHHAGLRSLGTVAVIGIAATFASATIFFPCLLAIIDQVRSRTKL